MIIRKATVFVAALLIVALGASLDRNISFAAGIDLPRTCQRTCYDDAGNEFDCSGTCGDGHTEAEFSTCPGCSGPVVVITNTTFTSGTNCICIAETSITIGMGVIIQSGANVILVAPTINFQSGFHAERGSAVKIETEDPPPPPG
jgi:hypothetical protein